ncbi:MAG TPA: hypothetical protein DEV81_17050 [Cyanobacteria bacterium UBA11049]|nr:hypothetical protein [Cyanobacteria bacterium UBA11049]
MIGFKHLNPYVCFNLIKQELKVFPISQLSLGLTRLISIMNQFDCLRLLTELSSEFLFSFAQSDRRKLEHYIRCADPANGGWRFAILMSNNSGWLLSLRFQSIKMNAIAYWQCQ